MSESLRTRVQALLGAEQSPQRSELLGLGFDAIVALPVRALVDRDALREAIDRGLTRENAARIATRHVLPALERIASTIEGRPERLGELLSPEGERLLVQIVRSGKGPRFGWLRGAIDADDVRPLVAPVVQQLLTQFTAKLPIPGFSSGGSGGSGGGGGLGGLVGMLGKQVQRSAGQLADLGRGVMGGLIKDFSQSATTEFRLALRERLKSPEGKRALEHIRDRVVAHVMNARLADVTSDLMHLPRAEIAEVVARAIEHLRAQPLFRAALEGELDAALAELEARTLKELLEELGLYEQTRTLVLRALDPGLSTLARSDEFGAWLERLLSAAGQP